MTPGAQDRCRHHQDAERGRASPSQTQSQGTLSMPGQGVTSQDSKDFLRASRRQERRQLS